MEEVKFRISLKLPHFAILLAAATSTRMDTYKSSLPWSEGKTLLSYQQFIRLNFRLWLCY